MPVTIHKAQQEDALAAVEAAAAFVASSRTKLTADEALLGSAIIRAAEAGATFRSIASLTSYSHEKIRRIANGMSWR